MDHDQRFKTLLKEFFREFLELFFPEWAARIDFSQVDWLEQEVFPDPPEGKRRALDLVAQLNVRVPPVPTEEAVERTMVLIHVEIESADSVASFRRRMSDYYHFLHWKHRLPVLPIALFLQVGLDGIGWDKYEEHFWGRRLSSFEYSYIGLPALDGEHYISGENLLGVALASPMRLPADRRLELGQRSWSRLVELAENEQRRYLLCDCVGSYIPRDEAERDELERRVKAAMKPEEREMLTVSLFDKIRQEGREQALREGREQALRQTLTAILEDRFGSLSPAVRRRIDQLPAERLAELTVPAGKAASLDELGLEGS